VNIHFDGKTGWLSGFIWGENVGWIKVGSDAGGIYTNTTKDNWGVNMDADGNLSGFAWGENIGWINFSHEYDTVRINQETGKFTGLAWGGNVGYMSFSDDEWNYSVRTTAFDKQAKGTPNWWLGWQGVAEDDDEGDSTPAWQEYIADTDPNDSTSFFKSTNFEISPTAYKLFFLRHLRPAITRCYEALTLARGVGRQLSDKRVFSLKPMGLTSFTMIQAPKKKPSTG